MATTIDADRLGDALDAHAIGRALAAHLRRPGATVLDCAVVRYRHRPGGRCVVQYAVTVREPDGAIVQERVVGHWRADAAGAGARARKLARRAAAAIGAWTAAFPPVFFDEATDMVASTYPWDGRLPGLATVAAGTSSALLTPMRLALGLRGDVPAHVEVTGVRYRERLNAVLRYDLHAGAPVESARPGRFFVKVYGDDGGARMNGVHAALARLTSAEGRVRVTPAVDYVEALRCLVTAAAPGRALDLVPLERGGLEATLQTVAAGLAAFGALPLDDRSMPLAGAPARATRRSVAALAPALPDLAPVLAELARATETLDLGTAGPAGLVHGDLKLEHVFVDGPQVHLIDLDSCHRGTPAWDLALLSERWWAARDAAAAERPLADWGGHVLAMAYWARVRPRGLALPVMRCAASLDVAAGLVKRREPDWQARATRLVARAARHLQTRTA